MDPNRCTAGTIKRCVRRALAAFAPALIFVVFIAAAPTAAAQTGQASDPVAVVTAFIAAIDGNDLAAAKALMDPAFRKRVGPDSTDDRELGKDEFPKLPLTRTMATNVHQIDANTVEMDVTLSGPSIPPVVHPFTFHATFTVKNGLITQLIDRFSPQTKQDLAALGPPPGAPKQMPNTGESDSQAVMWLLVLGVVCVLAGTLVRRIRMRQ